MSKAFTKETETEAVEPDTPDPLPKDIKNYVTPNGLRLLRDELDCLRRVERPKVVEVVAWAAGNGDRSENGDYIYGKKRLREIDRRLRFLMKRIESAEVVDPARQKNRDQVFFGATVTYVDADGGLDDEERTLRIVGIDEASVARGEVSWISPIARALMKAEEGDVVAIRTPNGAKRIEVMKIAYEEG
ncbi:MAG TPA: transcription elongation factor GreB [Alphaproteobacteria bacterium]|nr:transcription elongation factor GreB [Alphaproteobacteria bacterium]